MKILAVFAHPDDESFGPAGTLAKATNRGHTLSLLTLTHGESGSLGISKNLSAKELAERRSQELRCAAKKLGIQYIQIKNLADKYLQDIPEQKGIEIIGYKIKQFEPDIVITYHENTISGHPDHLAVTNWTYNAVKSISNPPRLLYYGLSKKQTSMVTFSKLIPIANNEITHKINVDSYIDDKIAAIHCHETQSAIWEQFVENNIDFKQFSQWESYVQKWPKPENNKIKYDLFER